MPTSIHGKTHNYGSVHNFVNHRNTVYALVDNPNEEKGLEIVSTVANKTKWRSLRTFSIPSFEQSIAMYTNGVVAYMLTVGYDTSLTKLYSINLVDTSQGIVSVTLPYQVTDEYPDQLLNSTSMWLDETTDDLYLVGAKALWALRVGLPGRDWQMMRNFSHHVNFITANQDILILANVINLVSDLGPPANPAMHAIQFDKLSINNNKFETIELKSPYVFDINIIENTIVVIYGKENKDDKSNNIVTYTYDKTATILDIQETGKYYIDELALDKGQIYDTASADILKNDKLLTIGLVKTRLGEVFPPLSVYFVSVQLDENGSVSNPISSTVENTADALLTATQFSYTSTNGVCFALGDAQDFYRSTDFGNSWAPENIITV